MPYSASCFSVFFAEKAYIDILCHILQVKCMHGHFNFFINLSSIVKQFPTKSFFFKGFSSPLEVQN